MAVVEQARPFFKSRGAKLRRIWLAVEQKTQVIARSFLMKHNFHHTASVSELLKGRMGPFIRGRLTELSLYLPT